MVDQGNVGTEVLAAYDFVEENTKNTTSSSKVDKKVDNIRPKPRNFEASGRRKSRKPGSAEGSPVQITRQRSEVRKNMKEQCKELCVSSDGIKQSPVQIKKTRSVLSQKGTGNQTGVRNEIKLVQLRKAKSDSAKALYDSRSELRKMNSEPSKNLDQLSDWNSDNSLSLQLMKAKTLAQRNIIDVHIPESDDKNTVNESNKDPVGGIKESPVGIKSRSDEDCKELRVCQEKSIANNVGNEIQIVTTRPSVDFVDGEEEEIDKEIEVGVENKSLGIEGIKITVQEQKLKLPVIEEKKLLPSIKRSEPIPRRIVAKNQAPAISHARIHPSPTKTKPISDNLYGTPSKLQSFADLIMWRDVPRSAFVFGIGTFAIISSSYTKDLNISFVSLLSYLGLVCLGASFIFKSLISRAGSIDVDETNQEYVVGEEVVVWLIELALPYVNEFLMILRSLFSADPATTMKLAVLLFILARCGGSITIWKMTKLGFFGVFMVPKLCSSYSSQLAAYGTFWIRRFEDAWESCSHKKAVGLGMFTLVWNLSSVVARIWAVFMLFVAFKYYQQRWIEGQAVQEEAISELSGGQQLQG